MDDERDFSGDQEFTKLLLRDRDIDLTLVSLEIARDATPDLQFEPTLDWIAARADELLGPVAGAWSEADGVRRLCDLLGERHGLRGDSESFHRPESSYLPDVIARKRGIPISLSLLYMAVARKVGIDLHGVAAPQHFLLRYNGVAGPMFIDAFGGGQIMDRTECLQFLRELTRLPAAQLRSILKPADARTIVVRMLNNLKSLHAQHEDWPAAWQVQERLVALKPASYDERRDLAFIALRCERSQTAIRLLEDCADECPEEQRDLLDQHLNEAKRQLARWN